jgi:hypothetical protein
MGINQNIFLKIYIFICFNSESSPILDFFSRFLSSILASFRVLVEFIAGNCFSQTNFKFFIIIGLQ